jgi:hypothetical protein
VKILRICASTASSSADRKRHHRLDSVRSRERDAGGATDTQQPQPRPSWAVARTLYLTRFGWQSLRISLACVAFAFAWRCAKCVSGAIGKISHARSLRRWATRLAAKLAACSAFWPRSYARLTLRKQTQRAARWTRTRTCHRLHERPTTRGITGCAIDRSHEVPQSVMGMPQTRHTLATRVHAGGKAGSVSLGS